MLVYHWGGNFSSLGPPTLFFLRMCFWLFSLARYFLFYLLNLDTLNFDLCVGVVFSPSISFSVSSAKAAQSPDYISERHHVQGSSPGLWSSGWAVVRRFGFGVKLVKIFLEKKWKNSQLAMCKSHIVFWPLDLTSQLARVLAPMCIILSLWLCLALSLSLV